MIKNILILLLFPLISFADSRISFLSGSGIGRSKDSGIYTIKYQETFDKNFQYGFDVGYIGDSSNRSTVFTSFLLGKQFGDLKGFHMLIDLGLVSIATPDGKLLVGSFQFTEEVSLGYKSFEFGYKHLSNAGIRLPNLGRDYFFMSYKLSL